MKILLLVPANRYRYSVARDLLYGCWCKGARIGGASFPPLALILLATILKDRGHDAKIVDAQNRAPRGAVFKHYLRDTDAVIVLTATATIAEDARALEECKECNPRLITIVFGSHPTFMPYDTLQYPGIDFIIRGEPEAVIVSLTEALETKQWSGLRGIGYKDGGRIITGHEYSLIENLDSLPIPDRRLLENGLKYANPVVKKLPYTTAVTSRGCPGRCTFCTVPAFYNGKVRLRSSGSILEELGIIQSLGYKEVFFRDEMFSSSGERIMEICRGLIKNRTKLGWVCSVKAGTVDLELMQLMKQAGCHMIRLGVESGVQKVLDAVKKDITLAQLRQTFAWAHKAGLDTHAHCMIGLPEETEADVKETIKFVKELKPSLSTFGICTPLPGTRLFQDIAARYPDIGDGSQCDISRLHKRGFYNDVFSSVSSDQLNFWIRESYKSFYLDPRYLVRFAAGIKSIGELKRVSRAAIKVLGFSCRLG